jgi:D-alanine transfer protein
MPICASTSRSCSTSLGTVELILALSERFGLEISPAEIDRECWASPRRIAEDIERRLGRPGLVPRDCNGAAIPPVLGGAAPRRAGALIVIACCRCRPAVRVAARTALRPQLSPRHHARGPQSRGLAIDRLALSQPDLLPVFGSSELIVGAAHDADELFKDYPTGFRPFEVASSAATPIIMMMRLASMGTALAGKRVVISITPAEFYRPHLEQPSYRANFSRVQATTLAFDTNIPYSLRRDAARRMLQYPTTIADDPILRWGLESLADRSAFGRARYAAVLPLGLLQGASLRLADHWQFVAYVYRHPELHRSETVVPVPINWATLEAHVDADALHQNQNNPFGFRDDYWTENGYKLVRRWTGPDDARSAAHGERLHHEPRNIEWRDFALLLDMVRSSAGRRSWSAPVLGPFLDYWGVTPVERAQPR